MTKKLFQSILPELILMTALVVFNSGIHNLITDIGIAFDVNITQVCIALLLFSSIQFIRIIFIKKEIPSLLSPSIGWSGWAVGSFIFIGLYMMIKKDLNLIAFSAGELVALYIQIATAAWIGVSVLRSVIRLSR